MQNGSLILCVPSDEDLWESVCVVFEFAASALVQLVCPVGNEERTIFLFALF